MRNIFFVAFVFALSFSGRVCAGNPVYSDKSLRNDAEKLLMDDPKETAEHATIVDLLRNDLSMVAEQVRVVRYRYCDRLETNK